ncbi:MAG TPA: DUF1674 domain-containing protein [Rhodospirillales bacterium]|nr:DUF1674 domain-containing protein [Rhodospirillales bacterium]
MRSQGTRTGQEGVAGEAAGDGREARARRRRPERRPREVGGPEGPEPTRYGDWERGGRCIDF